ncbi:unnamed protein product [Cyprideis torosa]|uniref:Calponin n=1 Tax=Cyprideis torosa TaxID=163714 RepID=A0A7R8WCU5_9CRUS|nr:unnamed protein product [Cyprideis torosa]CAG0891286.1 unnamed protein product [Cyprideis torosa]
MALTPACCRRLNPVSHIDKVRSSTLLFLIPYAPFQDRGAKFQRQHFMSCLLECRAKAELNASGYSTSQPVPLLHEEDLMSFLFHERFRRGKSKNVGWDDEAIEMSSSSWGYSSVNIPVLCKLMNTLQPGAIPKINTSGGQFKMMENLTNFLKAAENYGVPRLDLFQTVDLFEKKDLCTVTNMLFALGGATYKHPEWTGARLGPKPADQNVREFSEETLAEGKKVIGLQAGTNKGASQSGQNFGNTRHIIIGK